MFKGEYIVNAQPLVSQVIALQAEITNVASGMGDKAAAEALQELQDNLTGVHDTDVKLRILHDFLCKYGGYLGH
jgi:hypothetical protein